MEKKQKTFRQYVDELTANYFASWKHTLRNDEQTFDNIIESDKIHLLTEAAELFTQDKTDEINKLREERDELNRINEQQKSENYELALEAQDLRLENERLKKGDQYILGHTDGFVDGTKQIDSLKQLNSELVKGLENCIALIADLTGHNDTPFIKNIESILSKSPSDGYTKAKD